MHCHHHEIVTSGSIILPLFLAGFFGGFTHCVGMCGPIVLGQVGARYNAIAIEELTPFKKIMGFTLLPYHLGRMTSYSLLAILGSFIVSFISTPYLKILAFILLILAAVMFLASSLDNLPDFLQSYFPFLRAVSAKTSRFYQNFFMRGYLGKIISKLSLDPSGIRGYILGILLGFLPCGLIYASLATAIASGNTGEAALGMAVFALGTVPALVIVSASGHLMALRWKNTLVKLGRLAMLINSFILVNMAFNIFRG